MVERLGPSPSQPLAAGPGLGGGGARTRVRATLAALGAGELGLRGRPWSDSTYDPIRAMRAAAQARGGYSLTSSGRSSCVWSIVWRVSVPSGSTM